METNEKIFDDSIGERLTTLLQQTLLPEHNSIVSSFNLQFTKNKYLTTKQVNLLKNFENHYLNPDKEWLTDYDDEKKEKFKLAIMYYSGTEYFQNTVKRAIFDKDFIPNRKTYEKMCQNKYFIRASEYYKDKPRYEVGDIVTIRKSKQFSSKENRAGIIERIDTAPSFIKGGIAYYILWPDTSNVTRVIERYIKIYRPGREKESEDASTESD